jgi:hypothetical protein
MEMGGMLLAILTRALCVRPERAFTLIYVLIICTPLEMVVDYLVNIIPVDTLCCYSFCHPLPLASLPIDILWPQTYCCGCGRSGPLPKADLEIVLSDEVGNAKCPEGL